MLQERFPQILIAKVVPAPTSQHDLLVRVPRFDEVAVDVAEEAPGLPINDGDDGAVHGSEPSVDGTVRKDEFGIWVGGQELFDHACGWEVHDSLYQKKRKINFLNFDSQST